MLRLSVLSAALLCLAAFASEEQFNTSFDVYYENQFIGDVVALVETSGTVLALDAHNIVPAIQAILKEQGITEHPLLQKELAASGMIPFGVWSSTYALIPEVDVATFSIYLTLPLAYKPIKSLSLQNSDREKKATIQPAKFSGWLSTSGRLLFQNGDISNNGTWRGSFGVSDWLFYADGSYGPNVSNPLTEWRFEYNKWSTLYTQVQIGYLDVPVLLNGQLSTYIDNSFGVSFSHSRNRYLLGGLVRNLPGGILELSEPSNIEIYASGVLVKRLSLEAGRYRLRDMFLSSGLHAVDLRIESRSGRIVYHRFEIESYALQPEPGHVEYTTFGCMNKDAFQKPYLSAGAAVYVGLGHGTALGFHGTLMQGQGYRVGAFIEQYFGRTAIDFMAWEQNVINDPQLGAITLTTSIPQFVWPLSLEVDLNFYNDTAPPDAFQTNINLSITPTLQNVPLFDLNLGWASLTSGSSGLFMRLTRLFVIANNITVNTTLNANAITQTFQFLLGFTLASDAGISLGFTQAAGTNAAGQFSADAQAVPRLLALDVNYNTVQNDTNRQLRTDATLTPDFVRLTGEANWQGLQQANMIATNQSLNYETTLLYADGSFAFAPTTNGAFAIVDAKQFKENQQPDVIASGRHIHPFFGRYGIGELQLFHANSLVIDPSQTHYGYDVQEGIIRAQPSTGYRIDFSPKTTLVVAGRLLLPDGKSLDNAVGQLSNKASGQVVEWITGSDGSFVVEAPEGVYTGTVIWEDKRYQLDVQVNEFGNVNGAVTLGPLYLKALP